MKSINTSPKLVALALGLALVAVWVAVFMALFLLQPNLAQKTVIVTIGAASTEAIFYAGTALFGISAFRNLRNKFRQWDSN